MGWICDWKSTFAGAVAESVAGFASEFVVGIAAEEFARATDSGAPAPAMLEVERAVVPAFVWAQA